MKTVTSEGDAKKSYNQISVSSIQLFGVDEPWKQNMEEMQYSCALGHRLKNFDPVIVICILSPFIQSSALN